jgi:rhodanese-related sulfurtransferase
MRSILARTERLFDDTKGREASVRYHFAFVSSGTTVTFVQNNWLLIMVFVLSGAMLSWSYIQRLLAAGRDIGTLEATRLINSSHAVLLDVRETKEYEGGRLPRALHIPLSQLATRGSELSRHAGKPIIVYCMIGNRSRSANAALARLGFTDVYNLRGGYKAWKDAGLPVEK